MNSRLYRLTALHQRIDNALRRLTILRSFDGFELIRLNALKLRAKHLIRGLAAAGPA